MKVTKNSKSISRKRKKSNQKGFGWYGSLNPDAGNVEKNIAMFNAAQPDGSIGAVNPMSGAAMGESFGEEFEEASTFTKYSYTGPIYHLGNKIAEKSRMFTMAKSFAQARNNFTYKAANGDIVGHYDIVDEFIKEVPEATFDDKSTIEEKPEIIKCDSCGTQLNPMGDCPVCDYGEDDLHEYNHIDSNLDALSQLNRLEEIV